MTNNNDMKKYLILTNILSPIKGLFVDYYMTSSLTLKKIETL